MPSYLWVEITYSNFNGCTVEVREGIRNSTHKIYNGCNNLSMIGLTVNCVSNTGHCSAYFIH